MSLQSERGRQLSRDARESFSKPKARRIETLVDVPQLTFDDFQDHE